MLKLMMPFWVIVHYSCTTCFRNSYLWNKGICHSRFKQLYCLLRFIRLYHIRLPTDVSSTSWVPVFAQSELITYFHLVCPNRTVSTVVLFLRKAQSHHILDTPHLIECFLCWFCLCACHCETSELSLPRFAIFHVEDLASCFLWNNGKQSWR